MSIYGLGKKLRAEEWLKRYISLSIGTRGIQDGALSFYNLVSDGVPKHP